MSATDNASTAPGALLRARGSIDGLCFVGGRAVPGGGDPFDLRYPGDGDVYGEATESTLGEATEVVAAAAVAQSSWAAADSHHRAAILHRAADLLRRDRERIAAAITLDAGKTSIEARREVGAAALLLRQAAAWAPNLEGSTFPIDRGLARMTWREPVGVVAAIIPFNAPLLFAALKVAPALAGGNAVVLKAPEQAPTPAVLLAAALHEAGLPTGVLGVVQGGAAVGATLVADDRVALVSLTGGTATGRRVMAAAAAAGPKPVLLELGGKSATIVFDDVDMPKAIAGTLAGVFCDAGQRCFSGTRILVQDGIADEFVERLGAAARRLRVGDPAQEGVDVGPVIGPPTEERVQEVVADAVERSATVVAGDVPDVPVGGSYVAPTLLVDAGPGTRAWDEELFAPVAAVARFGDDDEGIALANDSSYGLAGGCWTTSLGRALHAARKVRTGYFWVNAYSALTFEAPFGGVKQSGIGREFGRRGVEAYTFEKTVVVDTTGGDAARVFEVDTP